jgi:CubicO group peptidase (beta-lactamase class C family)
MGPRWAPLVAAALATAALGDAPGSPVDRAHAYLDEIWRATQTPGISVAVLVQGELIFSEGIGFADLDNRVPATGATVYNIGSLSKAVSTVAVLQLVEQKLVSLDDPIQKYVPAFPPKRAPVTLRHILTHTSGIRHYRPTDFPDDSEFNLNFRRYTSLEQAIRIFKDDALLFEPGAYYSYSSYATNLLQGVVETVSGLDFETYLRDRVWGPAGMTSAALDLPERIVPHRARGYLVEGGNVTNYPPEDVTYKFAGGGMIGSAEDLAYFAHALNDGRLLKPDTRALMWTPQVDPVLQYNGDDPPIPETRWKLGLIWRVRRDERGREFVYQAGTVKGFNALLIDYYHEGVVAAVVGNGHPVTPAFREALAFAEMFLDGPSGAP